MSLPRSCLLVLAGAVLLTSAVSAQPGVLSTVTTLPAAAEAASSISIAVNAGAIQSLGNVTDNVAHNFPSPVTITLTWDLHPSTGQVQVIGYFATPAAAMSSGPVGIPSSWIKGRVLTTGITGAPATFSPFTQGTVGGVGTAGGSLTLMSVPVLGYSKTGTKTIDLELQLDLVGRVLPPGNYTGTLNIRAVTQ